MAQPTRMAAAASGLVASPGMGTGSSVGACSAGWTFWRRAPMTTLQIVTIVVGAVVGTLMTLGFVGLVAVGFVLDARGCGSVDLTDPANYSVVRVANDTDGTVTIGDCVGAYCSPRYDRTVRPGDNISVQGECATSPGFQTSYRVTRDDGTQLGFIVIDTPRSRTDLTTRVSDASPDRGTPTPLS